MGLVLLLALLLSQMALAAPAPQEPSVTAASAIVMDYDTGEVLYEKDADTMRVPASMTKIMTAYGLALLLTMMIKKGMTPFLFIGFLLAAYLNLSVIAVALIGVCLAVVFMGFKFNGSHAAAGVDSDYDPLEDDED